MLKRWIQTDENATSLILRLALGVVFFAHGAQKMLGWFGGSGFSATLDGMSKMGLPVAIVALVIFAEFFGALGLLVGLLTRVASFGILCVMLGAVFMVHLQNGFFMNWFGNQKGEGIEYHLLVIAICLVLMILGGGRASIDRSMSEKGLSRR